jgi:bacteriorhodopsin
LATTARRTAKRDAAVSKLFVSIASFTLVLWTLYPVYVPPPSYYKIESVSKSLYVTVSGVSPKVHER